MSELGAANSRSTVRQVLSAFCLVSLLGAQIVLHYPAHAARFAARDNNTEGASEIAHPKAPNTAQIYWGAYIKGETYGYSDPPEDTRTIDAFEAHTQKSMSILRWGQAWSVGGVLQPFSAYDFTITRSRGYLPLLNWNSWESCCGPNQPAFSLSNILSGTYDAYITGWATAARNWGHPLFLQFDDEMN